MSDRICFFGPTLVKPQLSTRFLTGCPKILQAGASSASLDLAISQERKTLSAGVFDLESVWKTYCWSMRWEEMRKTVLA